MAEPIVYREDLTPYPDTPFPLGARRADDVRDYELAQVVQLPDMTTLPYYRYYGIYDSRDGDVRTADTPLNQNHCHAKGDRTQRDPLGCGHCVGYGGKHFLLAYPMRNKALHLTGSDIYHACQLVDEWPGTNYQGTSGRALMKVLQAMGYVGTYATTRSASEVMTFILSAKGPVIMSTQWTFEMFFPNKHGGYLVDQGASAGGHLWMLDGASRSRDDFRMLNSWGGHWGSGGRARIKRATLQNLLNRGGQAFMAVERYKG